MNDDTIFDTPFSNIVGVILMGSGEMTWVLDRSFSHDGTNFSFRVQSPMGYSTPAEVIGPLWSIVAVVNA